MLQTNALSGVNLDVSICFLINLLFTYWEEAFHYPRYGPFKLNGHLVEVIQQLTTSACTFQQELLSQLKSYFSESYDCLLVSADCLLREPWEANCALLVMPGGQDLPYLKALYPEGTRRIQQYVASGGNYFGICAGAYFACKRIEFEVGRSGYEVTGSRPLCFFDGTARGSGVPQLDLG